VDLKSQKDRLYASWNIHLSCNYRCPYCFFYGKWAKLAKHNRYLSVTEWVECWNKIYDQYGSVHIDISGGEPFTYPSFLELVFEFSKRHTLGIITNLSWDVEPFVKKISPVRVKVYPSFHPYFANIGSFLRKIIFLKDSGFEISVSCVGYPPVLKKLLVFKKEFENKRVNFSVQPFRGVYRGVEYPKGYTSEEKEIIVLLCGDPLAIEYQLEGKITKGRLCSAGQKYIRVHSDSSVFRCAHSKIMGDIMDRDFKLLEEPLPCESEFCDCKNEFIYLVESTGDG